MSSLMLEKGGFDSSSYWANIQSVLKSVLIQEVRTFWLILPKVYGAFSRP